VGLLDLTPEGDDVNLVLAHPLDLLLVPLLALAAAAWWHRVAPRPTRRQRLWAVVLPGISLVLLVLALSAPRVGTPRPSVLAVDRSASVDPAMRAIETRWLRHSRASGCLAPCRPVRFAGTPDASSADAPTAAAGATDLQSALGAAIGLVPRHGRVVALSDGGETEGDLLASAGLARRRDVSIDWVPLAGRPRDAAITAIHAPAAVHVGDPVPLTLTVHSTVGARARLEVRRDGGALASQNVILRRGDNPLLLLYTATRRGWQSFDVTIALAGDAVRANDSMAAVTDVTAAPRVLIAGDASTAMARLLAQRRLQVTPVAAGALPSAAGSYAGDAALVLDDVAASQLSARQLAALQSAVRLGGLGLVVLGGPHSFSLGGYWRSPLQRLLPVTSLVPGNLQRRNLAVELVLDRSGSMADIAGGLPKIAMARAAARQTAAFLAAHHDELGIVDFDIAARVLVPIRSVAPGATEAGVDHHIAGLQANGGTNIYQGLAAGLAELSHSRAKVRHMILMTDGISAPAGYGPLLATLRRDHVSVATVALGADADRGLLSQIARATGGRAYVTENAAQLPRIFAKETQLSAKPVRVSGQLKVSVSADSPIVRSLAGARLPGLSGNVVVTPKVGAEVDLEATGKGHELDPALSEWQIGAGRVVSWTPGAGPPWATAWLGQPALWNDVVRWSERGVTPPTGTPQATGRGTLQIDLSSLGPAALGITRIDGTLVGAVGPSRAVSFTPVAPGLLQADVGTPAPGVERFALRATGAGRTATGEVALPYPAEYSPVPIATTPMAQLTAATGGRILPSRDTGVLAAGTHPLRELLALLALVAFALGVGGRMIDRGTAPGHALRKPSASAAAAGGGGAPAGTGHRGDVLRDSGDLRAGERVGEGRHE
jgi:hypothetical protein